MQHTDIFGGGHVCENQRCHQKVTVIHVVFNPSDFMNGFNFKAQRSLWSLWLERNTSTSGGQICENRIIRHNFIKNPTLLTL